MSNTGQSPNKFHASTNHTYTVHFGAPYGVQRIHPVTGLGHTDHIRVSCHGGVTLDFTLAAATELTRRLPEAIGAATIPDCSGSVAEVGEP
jgi:hypothetical protein